MPLWASILSLLLSLAIGAVAEDGRGSAGGVVARSALMRSEGDDDQLTTSRGAKRALSRLRDQHVSPSASMRTRTHQLVYNSLISLSDKGMSNASLLSRAHVARRRLQKACVPTNEKENAAGVFADSAEFHQQVKDGRDFARDKRIIFAGVWRDGGGSNSVKRIHTSLSAFGSFFQDHQLIMLEHAATGDTVKGMTSICDTDDRAICFSLQGLGKAALDSESDSVRRSAILRSALLQKALEFDPAGIFDFMVVVDDDVFSPRSGGFDVGTALAAVALASPTGPIGAFDGASGGADAVCAFQLSGWTQESYDARHHRGPTCRYQNFGHSPLCLARSCGGGLALYSLASIRAAGCDYDYYEHPTSEHVPFNECLRERGYGRFFVYKPWAIPRVGPPKGQMSEWHCVDV